MMEQRKEIQRVHYDHQTRNCEPGERYGARISMPAYRTPFDFVENFFLSQEMKGKKVLDYGCGTGYFSIFLAKQGAQVTGLDISPNSIRVANDCALFHDVQGSCQFLEGDCEDLPFSNESFDYLISVGNLSCLDLDRALSQITRVMKAGGGKVLILDTLGDNPLLNFSRKIKLLQGQKTKYHVDHVVKKMI